MAQVLLKKTKVKDKTYQVKETQQMEEEGLLCFHVGWCHYNSHNGYHD